MNSANPLKDLCKQLLCARKRKVARRTWKAVKKLLRAPDLTPQQRREAYIFLREELRAIVIDHTDSKYSSAPHMFPRRLLAFLNLINEVHALMPRSILRPGEYELTMELSPLFKALEHCETYEEVYRTFKMLKERIEELPELSRDACYVRLLRVIEDCILTEYLRSYPHDSNTDWHDHLILSLLTTVDASPYGQFVLDFTFFDGDRFIAVDIDALVSCRSEGLLRQYVKTLHSGLLSAPADFGGYILSRITSDLPMYILRQIKEAGIQLDDTSALLADMLENITSGEIFRTSADPEMKSELEEVLICMNIASEMALLSTPFDLRNSWARFLESFRNCPQHAELLAHHLTLVISVSIFSLMVNQHKNRLSPATLMLMRFYIAASEGVRWLGDEVPQAWVLDEESTEIGGVANV